VSQGRAKSSSGFVSKKGSKTWAVMASKQRSRVERDKDSSRIGQELGIKQRGYGWRAGSRTSRAVWA